MHRRTLVIVAAVVTISAALGGTCYWKSRQDALAAQQGQGRQVAVRRGTLVATVSASGSIAPEAQVMLNFQMPGTADKVNVVVGQNVEAGEVLGQLKKAENDVKQAEDAYNGVVTADG